VTTIDEIGSLTIRRVHELGVRSATAEMAALLARVPTTRKLSDPCVMGLRALMSVAEGDVPAALALFRRAIEHSDPQTGQYLIDLYTPLLLTRTEFDEVERLLDVGEDVVPELAGPFLAIRAQVAARRGRDAQSRTDAAAAIERARGLDNPYLIGRVLQRTAFAAYYREDFGDAQELALEAARLLERLESRLQAARTYSILYVIANDWLGNPEVARFYAQRIAMHAHAAGDVGFENYGVIAQLEIAAETGDVRRLGSLRARLLANPLHEQYHERFAFALSEALVNGWNGRFDAARTILTSVRVAEGRTLPERALCNALLAVTALGEWRVDEARRFARLAITETAHRAEREPLFDGRRRLIARLIASGTCVALGDPSRARRALSRSFDPDQRFAELFGVNGIGETDVPPLMRGYARFLNVACEKAKRSRPRLQLTNAEMTVLRAFPEGMTVATLAATLGKSPKTIEAQVSSIYAKLNVSNRAQAIQRARDLGLYA
jgi:DNA-binding CsgD family transcriptional regulator